MLVSMDSPNLSHITDFATATAFFSASTPQLKLKFLELAKLKKKHPSTWQLLFTSGFHKGIADHDRHQQAFDHNYVQLLPQ